jgi:hypothetical protein
MGTCVPKQILGSAGYLSLKQTSLESITLVTDSYCKYESEDSNYSDAIDLSHFHALRGIAWIGLHTASHIQTLRTTLEVNSKHLTHLQLERVQEFWDDVDTDDEDGHEYIIVEGDGEDGEDPIKESKSLNYFARKVIGLKQPTMASDPIFPALKSLSLAFLPLERAKKTLVYALNGAKLSHLSLRSFPGGEDFLRALVGPSHLVPDQKLKLSSLNYTCEVMEDDGWISRALERIFSVAPELTDLFLSIPKPDDPLDLWLDIRFLPLKRFVYDQKRLLEEGVDDLDPLES